LNDDPFDIQIIKLKHLEEFARSSLSDPVFRDVAPISLLRAESQSRNPQGDPDDTVLLVARHDSRCIGYHGLLPGRLKYDNRVSKIYWLVTFYLDAAFRGRGYGKRLVTEIQNTATDLVTTGITDAAAGVYRSAGFRRLGELAYYQMQPESTDVFTATNQNLKSRANEFISKPVDQLSEIFENSAVQQDSMISFQRDIKTINWMLRNPWVVSRQDARKDVAHYYFSRVRDLFEFVPLEIFTPDGITRKGYLVMSISRHKHRTTIKVLDYYFHDSRDRYIAGCLAMKYAENYRSDRLEYPAGLANLWGNRSDFRQWVKKKNTRLYLFYPQSRNSPLTRLAQKITLNYCDSDTAFT
jgi:GNAT superfamily N-acetyltransferase